MTIAARFQGIGNSSPIASTAADGQPSGPYANSGWQLPQPIRIVPSPPATIAAAGSVRAGTGRAADTATC